MYTNPNPNLTPQCWARKYEQTDARRTMTLARWPIASGAKNKTKKAMMALDRSPESFPHKIILPFLFLLFQIVTPPQGGVSSDPLGII